MSELAVGSIAGLASNGFVVDVASGSQLTQPGMILQVVSTTKTDTFSASVGARPTISGAVTGLSVSITPTSASSKLLVLTSINSSSTSGNGNIYTHIFRDGSASDFRGDAAGSRQRAATGLHIPTDNSAVNFSSPSFLDDAGSTATTTFDVRLSHSGSGTATVYINRSQIDTDDAVRGRSASSITVMEIAG